MAGAEPAAAGIEPTPFERTPSRIDRSTPPALGERPQLRTPEVWTADLANGMRVSGVEHHELPLVQFSIRLEGGLRLDDPGRLGVANLITDMLMEGTRSRTPEELEVAIEELGASISLVTSNEAITLRANTLTQNYAATLALAEEIPARAAMGHRGVRACPGANDQRHPSAGGGPTGHWLRRLQPARVWPGPHPVEQSVGHGRVGVVAHDR